MSGKPKLVRLEEENLIACKNGIYTLTRAGRDFLKENDRNIRHFQEITEAEKCEHELKITSFLIKHPHFYKVFYPTFDGLKPDACIIWGTTEQYKIQFLEVEEEKPNWTDHLKSKKERYILLAKDFEVWNKWWRFNSEILELPFCNIEDFCFSVLCNSKITFSWEGWEWQIR